MQESKGYIIKNIKTLLNLQEAPYQLSQGTLLDKFLNSDQQTLLLQCQPTKKFKVIQQSSKFPTQGHIVTISKLRSGSALNNFFNISVKPASQYKYLSNFLSNVYEPIITRTKDPSLFAIKQLKAVLANSIKTKLINQTDLNFTTLQQQYDFWQQQDIENPSARCSYFLKQYTSIAKLWKNVEQMDFSKLGNLIETTWNVLIQIWNSQYNYNQKRFIKLIQVFQTQVKSKIKLAFLRQSDLFQQSFDIKQKIIQSIFCCKRFINLCQFYQKNSKRKLPALRTKSLQQLLMKIQATQRIKTKVQMLNKMYKNKLIAEDPSGLIFLLKAQNFMTNYMAMYKNNPKAQQKLQKQKANLDSFCKMIRPQIQKSLSETIKKQGVQYLYKALQKWYFFLSDTQISENTVQLQDKVLQKVLAFLQQKHDETLRKQQKEPSVPQKLKIFRIFKYAIRQWQMVLNQFTVSSNNYPKYKQKSANWLQQIQKNEKKNLKIFRQQYQGLINDKINGGKVLGKVVQKISINQQEGMTLQFSPENILFIRQMKKIMQMNFALDMSDKLLKSFEEAKKYHKQNNYLKSLQARFNSMQGRLQFFQKNMLKKQLTDFYQLVQNPPIKKKISQNSYQWKDQKQLDTFIQQLTKLFERLAYFLKLFNDSEAQIQQIALDILSIQFVPNNFFVISQKLENVTRIIDSVSTNRDTTEWRGYWKYKLTQIVSLIWKQMIIKGVNIPIILGMVYANSVCQFAPELNEVKQKYMKQLKTYVGWPCQSKHLNGVMILQQQSQLILSLYKKTELTFRQLEQKKKIYNPIVKSLDIDVDILQQKIAKDQITSEQLSQILLKLKQVKNEIDLIPEQERIPNSSIILSNVGLKKNLTQASEQKIEAIIQLIKYSIKIQSEQIQQYITNAMKKIENKPNNMNQMAQAIKQFDKIHKNEQQIQKKIKQIQARNNNVRAITGASFNTVNMMKRWQNFQIASVQMGRILNQQKDRLQQDSFKKSQQIQNQVNKLYQRYQQIKPKSENLDREQVLQVYGRIKQWYGQWSETQNKVNTIKLQAKNFNMKVPEFTAFQKTKSKLNNQLGNWLLFMEFRNEVQKFQKEEWITFRGTLYKYGDIINIFIQKAKDITTNDSTSKFFKQMLNQSKQSLSILKCLTGQNFEKQHWGMLFSILKIKNVTTADKLLFVDLLQSDLLGKANEIRDLQARAKGQITIKDALAELQAWGLTRQFQLTDYNSMGRVTSLIKQWKDVMTEVSDHQAMVSSIRQSRWAGRFKDQIQKYQVKFGVLDDALLKLNQIQRKWIYLQPIFMRGALPSEQGRWKRLDEQYRNIMTNISNNPTVIFLSSIAGFQQTLSNIMVQLEKCQKALNDFLEQKRNKFPRFYFLGDDDMLQILGQSQNPTIIQMHLKKLFSGINKVKFSENNDTLLAMKSSLNEQVQLMKTIEVTEIVQNWLQQLNKNMISTLKQLLTKINNESDTRFKQQPSQIICLINQIVFSKQAVNAIQRSTIKQMKSKYQQNLSQLTKKCHQFSDQLILSKIKSLILDLIHQISVLDLLLQKNVKSLSNWNWHKQLKFIQNGQDVRIAMADANFQYTFQYQGNAQKLVYTPLTDKCYLTLTQAMKMGLGGNPYGPAGTGKTQSVKALALAFGRQCLVFNCDEGLDFHSMGRIFIGLVKCGAWGCFDEFNRLLQQQLSAISQQIQIIQEAIKAQQKHINLLGKQVDVNFNSGIFVTLNPAGKGYGGRSKLPDNLKQLFRPIAMSVPDNQLIAQVLLFSQGFTTAKQLASKIITIFTLSRQLLSKQLHYDWGLRALKTILTVAGRLIFQQKQQNLSEKKQGQILIKALRINTISKLTFNDMLKFNVLVQDVFPGVDIKDIIYEQISKAVQQVFKQQKYELQSSQLNKILQFYEATKQRIGAVLVGPSGCGKTTIWKTLKKAYEKLNQPVKTYLINPKSMPRSAFLGHMNNDTRQFSQGVLTASARQVIKQDHTTLSWIICDGDVDPQWIQALNSVLDDNHLLTLPTGQRIAFGSNVNFIFETDNLQFASPATISRMGMIFMNQQDININGIISKWAKSLSNDKNFIKQQVKNIQEICNKIYESGFQSAVETTKVGLVRSALSLLQNSSDQQQFKLNLVKGLASNYHEQSRLKIFQIVFGKPVPGNRDPLSLTIKNGKIGQFKDKDTQQVQKIYMTKSILKDIEIVQTWLRSNQNVIIVGKQGCGKSLLLQASIQEMQKHQKCKLVTIHCNRQTKAQQIIHKLFQTCQKVTSANGRVLKPQNASRQIFLLKQVNLPKPDKYNTIQLITFLQSLITHQGFYDQNLQFVRIGQGIQFVCIMKPSSTIGRFQLTTRFVSNLRVLKVQYQSVGIKQKLKLLTPHAQAVAEKLNQFWHIVGQNFKYDDNAHYLFTPRNLNGIVDHLQSYNIKYENQNQLFGALYYEVNKQFGDRLVDASSKQKFKQLITPLFGKHQQLAFYVEDKKLKSSNRANYIQILQGYIKAYENEVKQTNIILVKEAVDLMGSIEKKMIDRGHMLLAGSSGSLRKTSVRVLAFKHKITLCTLSNMRNPSLKQFYKDLKSIIEQAAGHNKHVILFLQQHQLGKNLFYQKINSLISSGEITGLFSPDQIEGIVQDPEQLRSQFYGKSLYECFVERTRKNLSIILSFDHRNKQFYQICSSNPAFYSFCRIVWLNCYTVPSLKQICSIKTKQLNIKEMDQLSQGFINIHKGSSLKYIDLIQNFKNTYKKLQSKSGNRLGKLNMGLKKLRQTSKIVDQLTADAIKKQKLLTKKQKEASQSLDQITQAMQQATASKSQKQKLQQFLASEQKKIQKDRKQVMTQLQKVQPLIEQAKNAVSGLSKRNIENIRAFINPPQAVRHVLKAVLTIFGNKDDTWNSMKNFLKVCQQQILYFEINNITSSIRKDVQNIIDTHAYSFQRQNIIKASQEAVPLRDWALAVIQYSKTYQKIRPLKQNLDKIQKQLSVSRKRKNQCVQKIAEADAKQIKLNDEFIKKKNQAQNLKLQLVKVKNAMESGKQLLEKLQGQKNRWQSQSDKLKVDVQMLPRSTALAAAFITYVSASPQNIRQKKIQQWKKAFGCHYFNFLNFVTSQALTLQQISEGLPNDQLSIQNSQIIALQTKIPLIIDPHTQATSWLKAKLGKSGTVQTLTQQDPKFINTLQLAVRFGKTLVLQEIDYIQPILTPILKGDFVRQGPRNLMQIGQKSVDVNETFRFVLATRNSSIQIPYHQADLVTIINFSVTRSGLQGKLLSLIISHFQPQIQKQKQKLLQTQEKLKINLSELEQKLLKQLADSSGNILENKQLIKSLNNTKQQGQIVINSLKQSQTLQRQIDQKRQIFLPISEMGAKLYISLSILKKLNPMYKYNLAQFISMFQESLQAGKRGTNQIQEIQRQLIKIVYDNISIGLLKAHRLLLGLVIIKQVLDQMIPDQQFAALVGNMPPTNEKNLPSWIDEKERQRFSNFLSILSTKPNFNSQKWSQWHKSPQSQSIIPKDANLTAFQQCILIAACRPDRLISAFTHFVMSTLNLNNLSGIQINMQVLSTKKMTNKIPCLFIVSVGFDPSKQIQEHANKAVGKNRFQQLSMGGDQNQYALQLLKQAAQKENWLCLKNLHLVNNFVIILQKQLLSLQPHQNFRLFLTTEARQKFPPILLQTCYKVSYEAPPGLKKNFARILSSQSLTKQQPLAYVLTYFHALIQQRKNYIPQGWTKSYQFNYGDYKSGLVLMSQLGNKFDIDWEMLYGLMSDTIYGGRIDNWVDLRILNTYLQQYFNQEIMTGKEQLLNGLNVKNIEQFKTILPDQDSPHFYGLPHGIDKAINRIQGKQALDSLKILSTAIVESAKFSRQSWQKILTPLFTLWKGLQKFVSSNKVKEITEKQIKTIDPIDSFVYNQAYEAKKNYELIRNGLNSLQRVLFGNDILVSEVEQMGKVLLRGQVYSKWTKLWQGPDLVTQWLKVFVKKLISLQKWVEMAQSQKLLASQLDLSQVYRPQIFFNALKQKVAREKKIPVDSLSIKCSFSNPSGQISAKLKNLVLEGCSRSGNSLVDSKGDVQYEEVPVLYIYYTQSQKSTDLYTIPFYTDSTRSNLLALLPIKAEGGVNKKIIAGAAFMVKS